MYLRISLTTITHPFGPFVPSSGYPPWTMPPPEGTLLGSGGCPAQPRDDPDPRREPHAPDPVPHARLHRGERGGLPPVAADVRDRGGAAGVLLLPGTDPLRAHAPDEPGRRWCRREASARRRLRSRRGTDDPAVPRAGVPAEGLDRVGVRRDVPPRRVAAHRGEHAVPVGLREQRRGPARPRVVPDLLPARWRRRDGPPGGVRSELHRAEPRSLRCDRRGPRRVRGAVPAREGDDARDLLLHHRGRAR